MGGGKTYSIKRWLFTTNHKDVGILYLVTALYFFIVAGTLALLFRVQLSIPENNFMDAAKFNQAVTNHGLLMVFWFISPLGFAFANYFVPIQLGAKDMAFPRLNALSYWLLLFGGLLMLAGFFLPGGAADFGWTAYAPLNTDEFTPNYGANLTAFGLLFMVASVTVGTVNFLVTIFQNRAKNYKFFGLPIFTWGIFLTVLMMLWAFPSLQAALVMLGIDRLLGASIFSWPEGGSILWNHLFWFFGHPEVYIVLFPGLALALDIIMVFSRRPLLGRKVIIGALIAAAILSFGVYAHHMFMTGVDLTYLKLHMFNTELISVPFGIITILAILSLVGGAIRLSTPMLFALGSIAVFIIGGFSGVFNSNPLLDVGNRGTYWIVAHFHYVMVGAALFALFGGLYYWFPKMTGRMYSERLGKIHFIVSFIGFNILYFPMFFLIEMPRRIFTYPEWTGWGPLNFIATVGAFIFGLSHLIMFANLIYSAKFGPRTGKNPWGAWSYEWLIDSPPSEFNFDGIPIVQGNRLTVVSADGAGIKAAEHHGDHLSPWPLLISFGPFLLLLGLGMWYADVAFGLPIMVIGAIVSAYAVYGWFRDDFAERFQFEEPPETKERWPFVEIHRVKLGMYFFLLGDAVFFAGLLGGYVLMRLENPQLPGGLFLHNPVLGLIATLAMVWSAFFIYAAARGAKLGNQTLAVAGLALGILLGISYLAITGFDWLGTFKLGFGMDNPLVATSAVVAISHTLHLLAGLLVAAYLALKVWVRGFTGHTPETIDSLALYFGFLAIVSIATYGLTYLF